jgi:ribosomal protein L24E
MKPACVHCGKPPLKRGEFLYVTPDGREIWLCGRKTCKEAYEGG